MRMREMHYQGRRTDLRHPVSCKLRVWQLPVFGADGDAEEFTRARVKNMSKGGLCAAADNPINGGHPVRCEIVIPGVPVPPPVIMKVRWVEKNSGEEDYKMGLQFLP